MHLNLLAGRGLRISKTTAVYDTECRCFLPRVLILLQRVASEQMQTVPKIPLTFQATGRHSGITRQNEMKLVIGIDSNRNPKTTTVHKTESTFHLPGSLHSHQSDAQKIEEII